MSNLKKSFYKFTEKFTARFKDKIICVSEFDRQIALEEKIAPDKKLITIHNGIKNFSLLDKKSAVEEILKSGDWDFQINEDDFIIGSIGNFYKTKGFEYLIETGKNLSSEKIKIVIMGKTGEERQRLSNLINTYKLKNKILLTRPEKPAHLLNALDVYVCSSVKEGLSYTIIEAMRAGRPIIATQVGGNPEMIKNHETGLLIESKNPKQIAEAIIKIMKDKALSERLGNQAKQTAEAEFTLEKMIAETEKVYK